MTEHTPLRSGSTPHWRSRRWGVLLLIVAGVIILARSDVLGAIVWKALLPVVMIGLGLDLLTEGRQRRRITTGALLAAVVCAPLIGIASFMAPSVPRINHPGGRDNTVGTLDGVQQVQARVALTAGDLSIRSLPERSNAVLAATSDNNRTPVVTRNGSTAVVNIDQPLSEGDLDLRLTRGAPLDLSIEVGSGDIGPLDLEDMRLRKLDLQQTAGNAEITLPDQGVMDVTIKSDFGDIELDLPDDLAARIEVKTSLGDVNIDDRFTQQDGVYVSEGYSDTAPNRATIHITKTAGNITIR